MMQALPWGSWDRDSKPWEITSPTSNLQCAYNEVSKTGFSCAVRRSGAEIIDILYFALFSRFNVPRWFDTSRSKVCHVVFGSLMGGKIFRRIWPLQTFLVTLKYFWATVVQYKIMFPYVMYFTQVPVEINNWIQRGFHMEGGFQNWCTKKDKSMLHVQAKEEKIKRV